jgi:hypothetical protein
MSYKHNLPTTAMARIEARNLQKIYWWMVMVMKPFIPIPLTKEALLIGR